MSQARAVPTGPVAPWAELAPATLGVGDVLDGENVVSGFTCPVVALFA